MVRNYSSNDHLLVSSGIAVHKLDGGTHELGQLRLWDVLLGLGA